MTHIVGSWGLYSGLGVEGMKKLWRYYLARWSAFPVMWFLAIEYDMPFCYGNRDAGAIAKWPEVGRYVKAVDPYRRPISLQLRLNCHCSRMNRPDQGIVTFDSLQIGHGDRPAAWNQQGVPREL